MMLARVCIYRRACVYIGAHVNNYTGVPIYYYDGARLYNYIEARQYIDVARQYNYISGDRQYMSIRALRGMPWCAILDIMI